MKHLFTSLALALALLPTAAQAATQNNVPYVDAAGTPQTPKNATIVESGTTVWSSGNWYVVNTAVTIDRSISVVGGANLILADGGSLTAEAGIDLYSINTLTIWAQSGGTGQLTAIGGSNSAGIGGGNRTGGIITINGGVITAQGGNHAAGIGGGNGGAGGTITINGGMITATGSDGGAGIGGGNNGAGGTITINGGAVTAMCGTMAAGIGGGSNGAGGDITINGGTVTATGSADDIGPGYYGSDGTLKITGGSVNPTRGRVSPQPINGGGDSVYLHTLTIGADGKEAKNAAVTAVVGTIGGSFGTDNCGTNGVKTDNDGKVYLWLVKPTDVGKTVTVTVNGRLYGAADYTAMDNNSAARLLPKSYNALIDMSDPSPQSSGTGWTYSGGTYTIQNGATVTVIGSNAGSQRRLEVASSATNVNITLDNVTIAGLNSGQSPLYLGSNASATLTLTGTNSLTAGNARAGIQAGNGTTLVINGEGTLTAQGGQYAAGIGGGDNVKGGNITISGGTVNAQGGQYAAGIGGGRAQAGGNIIINGGAVTANGGSGAAGIGGGSSGAGGTITINGGAVTANGGSRAAGIGGGGGEQGDGGTITISGGTVTATGSGGDDIGKSGDPISSNGTVKITGGSVNPTHGEIIQPTSDGSTPVYLNTLTIGGTPQTDEAVTAVGGALSGYGINGVKTDNAGKVYLWLPVSATNGTDAEEVTVTAGSIYKNTYRRGTSAVAKTLRQNYVSYSATAENDASGVANTTRITVTFSPAVPGLDFTNIRLMNGSGIVTNTSSPSTIDGGLTYTIPVQTNKQGDISVSVPSFIETAFGPDESVTVAVYKDTRTPSDVVWPSGLALTYGSALSSIDLGTNAGPTPGAFSWTSQGSTKPAVSNSNSTNYNLTFTPTDLTSFTTATHDVTVTVNPKPLTVSGSITATKEYDGNAVFNTTHINIDAATLVGVETVDEGEVSIDKTAATVTLLSGDVVSGATETGAAFSLAGSRAGNYTLTQPTVTASITQATLTITPHAGQSKVYNTSEPTLTYTSFGWKGGTDSEALLTGALARDGGEDVNTYNILAGNVSAGGNYAISFTAGKTFEITKAPAPSITFPTSGTSITYGQTLSASALSGGTPGFGAFAWTNPETLPTVTNPGYSVTFTPSPTTERNYETISQTTSAVSLMVNPKDIAAAAVHIAGTYIYNGSPHTPSAGDVTVTLSGFGTLATGTDYTYTGVTSGGTDIGTATVTVTGAGNFTGTATGTFEITQDNYPVTVSSAGTGASIGGRYRPGSAVEIYAGTTPAGYRFSHWTATPDATFADAYSPRTTFTMPSSAVTVTAHFELIPYYGIDIRPLNGGEVHADRTSAEAGETVTLTVRTYAEYRFDGIEAYKTGDAETSVELQPASEPDTYTFTMPDYDVTVSSLFTSFDQATVDEAVEEIRSAILSGVFTVAQATANTQPEVRSWLVETINARIASTGITVSADDIVFQNFMAAIAGVESSPAGRNGSVRFRLTLKKGSNGFARLTDLVGVITATRYIPTGIDGIAQPKALKAYVREGMLHVSGLIPGEQWSVYNITGSLIYSGTANSEEASLGLSARGVYIVTTKTRQLKIRNYEF